MIKTKYQEKTKTLTRSHDYRQRYFNKNQGHLRSIFKDGLFICPYCGKPMFNRASIAIDHIHSIRRVQYTKSLREHFKSLPDGVNDMSNLVHCCKTCNIRKGKRAGIYPFLAKYGMYLMPAVWLLKWAIAISLFTSLFTGIWTHLT